MDNDNRPEQPDQLQPATKKRWKSGAQKRKEREQREAERRRRGETPLPEAEVDALARYRELGPPTLGGAVAQGAIWTLQALRLVFWEVLTDPGAPPSERRYHATQLGRAIASVVPKALYEERIEKLEAIAFAKEERMNQLEAEDGTTPTASLGEPDGLDEAD